MSHPGDYCGVCGFDKSSCICQRECEGQSDDCTRIATTTRDTSDGYVGPEHFCEACAADYDHWVKNYDGPAENSFDRGCEWAAATQYAREQAWRLKR